MVVNFSPELVVIYAIKNVSLVKNFELTYSISSGDALTTGGLLGNVIIDDPIQSVPVWKHTILVCLFCILIPACATYSQVKTATFALYPSLCPAGYGLVPTGQQQGGLECQCEQNNALIINCEEDQDKIVVKVWRSFMHLPLASTLKHTLFTLISYSVY